MADIDVVPKKNGTSWVLWALAALAVVVVVWMLMGRNPSRVGLSAPHGSAPEVAIAQVDLVSAIGSSRS